MNGTPSQPFGRTGTTAFVHDVAQEQARRGSPGFMGRWSVEPQPAHAALVGIASLAGTGEVAMLPITTDVCTAVTQARHSHCVTVMLTLPVQKSWDGDTPAAVAVNGLQLSIVNRTGSPESKRPRSVN